MPRLSPRVKTVIPVSFDAVRSAPDMTITDIGMNGVYVRADLTHPKLRADETVVLNYSLNLKENLMQGAKVVWQDTSGYALSFYKSDPVTRNALWKYIASRLHNFNVCPFCGHAAGASTDACSACGWKLNFRSPQYFDYYEKTQLIRKINRLVPTLDTPQLYRIEEFIDGFPGGAANLEKEGDQEFVGTCKLMLDVFSHIRKVATTDISVMILGESGTGKEMTAQAIHERSTRKDGPFVAINCGAIPENLLESELFGHEKGAFTGAHASKPGRFEHADRGTIFLDEIGEMPLPLQVKLLRFLQDKNIERIGSVASKKVDVRLIAATNCDLQALIAEGRFRKDLYYRLDEFTINLPAVRERGDDKIILAKHFLNKFCAEKGVAKAFTGPALSAIMAYHWPGNVREIINKVKRAIVLRNGSAITPADLDLAIPKVENRGGSYHLSDALAQVEKETIQEVLRSCNNNVSAAAAVLGMTRQTLHRRLKLLGLRKL